MLLPTLSDAFGFELAVKSINLGLTREGEVVPDAMSKESVGPLTLGDEWMSTRKRLTPFTRVIGVAF